MATVRRGRDIRLGRDIAVKQLRLELASDPTLQARFRREAQAGARLNHPNIVSTYDTGSHDHPDTQVPVPFIVMELIEGHNLRDITRDGRQLIPSTSLGFTQAVLDALFYSHKAGIVHRDIKPSNVMVTPKGVVKVMDFGIARAASDSVQMTQTRAVMGTAQYLSPEQARGEPVDGRSDIYSTGCLLYELLAGRPPFRGDSMTSVAYQHVHEIPPPPSAFNVEVTTDMDAVVLRAMSKAPRNRYQSAVEMGSDVSRLLVGAKVASQALNRDALAAMIRDWAAELVTPPTSGN